MNGFVPGCGLITNEMFSNVILDKLVPWRGTQVNFALSEIRWEAITLVSKDEVSFRRNIRRSN
jgi:hypothetical protein